MKLTQMIFSILATTWIVGACDSDKLSTCEQICECEQEPADNCVETCHSDMDNAIAAAETQ